MPGRGRGGRVRQAGLEKLAFQNVGCSIAACRAIAELVPRAGALATLHLHNNMSDDAGAAAIAQARPRRPAPGADPLGSSASQHRRARALGAFVRCCVCALSRK